MGIRTGISIGSIVAMYAVGFVSDPSVEYLAIMSTQAVVFAILSLKELK